MEKQVIIRGAAILCAGVGISVFAAPHVFLDKPQLKNTIDLSTLQSTSGDLRTAGLSGSAPMLQFNPKTAQDDSLIPDATAMAQTADPSGTTDSPRAAQAVESRVIVGRAAAQGLDLGPQLAFASADMTSGSEDCTPRIEAVAGLDALIEISLIAPCHRDTRFVASHDDLAFSAFLGSDGRFSTYIPALSTSGRVDIFLNDDTHLHATVEVPDAQDHKRVVLQWTGASQFALHAYHDGAAYGANGHVHAGRPFDPAMEEAFLVSLGDLRGQEPMLAQVYSLPLAQMDSARVEVELAFAESDCGRDAMAFLSQTEGTNGAPAAELTFSVPDCPTVAGAMVMGLDLSVAGQDARQTGDAMLSGLQN